MRGAAGSSNDTLTLRLCPPDAYAARPMHSKSPPRNRLAKVLPEAREAIETHVLPNFPVDCPALVP